MTLDGLDCQVVIEVAVSSLNYDKKLKAEIYAGLGVREFWVVDANERGTWVHTEPTAQGWFIGREARAKRDADDPGRARLFRPPPGYPIGRATPPRRARGRAAC